MLVHHLGVDAESVDESLTRNLPEQSLVIVVPQRATELIVAHILLVLVVTPPDGDGFRLQETEFSLLAVGGPLDEVMVLVVLVGQQSVEELPQLHPSFPYAGEKKRHAEMCSFSNSLTNDYYYICMLLCKILHCN